METQHKKHILIVEDETVLSEILQSKMQNAGYSASVSSTGKTALQLLQQQNVDLVLLDVMLPEMDGIAVLKAMRSKDNTRETPVIMLSNLHDSTTIIQSLELGETPKENPKKESLPALARHGIKTYLAKRLHIGIDEYYIKSNLDLDELLKKIDSILRPTVAA